MKSKEHAVASKKTERARILIVRAGAFQWLLMCLLMEKAGK
ncbi:MAG: hypothetical protein OEV42_07770 [Deltaproteobacteria bacterium]|nr:hypothetical protein [Deltaproteobacteria bacterium]